MAAVNTRDWENWHTFAEFSVSPGGHGSGDQWVFQPPSTPRTTIVQEIRVTAIGDAKDVSAVLDRTTIKLEKSFERVFERPVNMLITSELNRDAEVEARVARLERMMTVLVEQDSAAGEALRRLGGVTDTLSLPSRLAIPVTLSPNDLLTLRMTVDSDVAFITGNFVAVRVSILGIASRVVPP